MYQKFGKRLLDLFLSGCAIVALSPVYLLVALAIKIDDPGPVFFRQKRIGIHKSYFQILKFRTMKMEAPGETPTHLLEDPEQYITRAGCCASSPWTSCPRSSRSLRGRCPSSAHGPHCGISST